MNETEMKISMSLTKEILDETLHLVKASLKVTEEKPVSQREEIIISAIISCMMAKFSYTKIIQWNKN